MASLECGVGLTDLDALRAGIVDTSRLLGTRRRRRAATTLATLTSADAMTMLAEAFVHDTDPGVVLIARRAIEATRERAQVDAAATVIFTTGEVRLAELLAGMSVTPSEPRLRALVYFLAGRFERYAEVDFDGSLLRAVHGVAGEPLRRALAEQARRAGRLDWVRTVAGTGRSKALTRIEWDAAAALLSAAGQWEELLRLAAGAPAAWVAPVLATTAARVAFPELVDLAAEADAAPAPAATDFGDTPPRRLRAGARVHSLAIARSGTAWIGGDQSSTRLWDLRDGHPTAQLDAKGRNVIAMAVSPDGRLLVTGDMQSGLRLWGPVSGSPQGELIGHRKRIIAIAISPDRNLIASGGHDRLIHFWNTKTGKIVKTIDPDPVWTASLAITPDGKLLASGGANGNLRLWHLPSGEQAAWLRGHGSHVAAMAISADGTLLASGSYDNTIRLWQLPTGTPAGVLTGHTRHILALAIAPDSKLLASVGKDLVVRLWHLPSGAPAGVLSGHTSQVECLEFSPDGLMLVSGASNGEVLWWTRRTTKLGDLIERRLERITTNDLDRLKGGAAGFSPDEKAWFDLVDGIVRWRGRHDIEITDATPAAAASAWDIEIGDEPRQPQKPHQPRKKKRKRR